jgi:hypothetical protein
LLHEAVHRFRQLAVGLLPPEIRRGMQILPTVSARELIPMRAALRSSRQEMRLSNRLM